MTEKGQQESSLDDGQPESHEGVNVSKKLKIKIKSNMQLDSTSTKIRNLQREKKELQAQNESL